MGIMLAVIIVLLVLVIVGLGWIWLVARPRPQRQIEYRKVSGNLHYLSLALETVFYRNIPGASADSEVVLALEVQGILPDGALIRTVLDVQPCSGQDRMVAFDRLAVVQCEAPRG